MLELARGKVKKKFIEFLLVEEKKRMFGATRNKEKTQRFFSPK
jgi:hypothetical protein